MKKILYKEPENEEPISGPEVDAAKGEMNEWVKAFDGAVYFITTHKDVTAYARWRPKVWKQGFSEEIPGGWRVVRFAVEGRAFAARFELELEKEELVAPEIAKPPQLPMQLKILLIALRLLGMSNEDGINPASIFERRVKSFDLRFEAEEAAVLVEGELLPVKAVFTIEVVVKWRHLLTWAIILAMAAATVFLFP